jgi:hypothetical protein
MRSYLGLVLYRRGFVEGPDSKFRTDKLNQEKDCFLHY